MAPMATEDGPSTGSRSQEIARSELADRIRDDEARVNAMRDDALPMRGAGPTRPDPRDPSVQGQVHREAPVDAAAWASFARTLMDAAAPGEHDGGIDAAEGQALEGPELLGPAPEAAQREGKGPRPARKPRIDHGGEDEGGSEPTAPPEGGAPPPPPPPRRQFPRVSPHRRRRQLDLAALLEDGARRGLLVGEQAKQVEGRMLVLTSRGYGLLHEALEPLDPTRRILVLQSLAAHRRPETLVELAAALAATPDDDVGDWLDAREDARPTYLRDQEGERPGRALLLQHFDPAWTWLREPPPPEEPAPDWPQPQWLGGAPRELFELCALAFLQAATGLLHPDDRPEDGASDSLTAALEPHAEAHPAIGRWTLTLCARAEDRIGLLAAAEAMLSARARF